MRFALAIAFSVMAGSALACANDPKPTPGLGVAYADDGTPIAWFHDPTEIYDHGILGDAIEAERLLIRSERSWNTCHAFKMWVGEGHVFEDTAPRVTDMDGDGLRDLIVVRTSLTQGAQLVVYEEPADPFENPLPDWLNLVAATPYIGQSNRWLAPIGAADLDGDGTMEIAYIDRPHLAKTLRIVSIDGDLLAEEIAGAGFTNHRIGERDIAGGVRDCGDGPEMIVASADWSQLVAVTYDGAALDARQIGTDTSRPAFAKAMACQ